MKRISKDAPSGEAGRAKFNLEPLVDGYGPLTARRIKNAARRFGEDHLRTDLKVIPLEQGERLQLAGLPGLNMLYMGVMDGKSVFQRKVGERIENQLMRASRGLRYDIFVGQYWTRDSIIRSFRGAEANFDAVSRVQALEILVYDKRNGTAEHSWLSLGANKDKVFDPGNSAVETKPRMRTERLPELPKATRRSMAPALRPIEPPTSSTLTLEATTGLVIEAARKYLSLAPTDGPRVVLSYSQDALISGHKVEFGREGGKVVLSFSRSGHAVREEVELARATLKPRELGQGYRIAFSAYPLDDNARGQVCDYLVLATVVAPTNQLHAVFVLGARG